MTKIINPSIILLTETWLSNSIPDGCLNMQNYQIIRRDRLSRGGGILIAVKKEYDYVTINIAEPVELQAIDVLLTNNYKLRFIVGYIPHASNTIYVITFFRVLQQLISIKHIFCIFGDFNHPKFDWNNLQAKSVTETALSEFMLANQPIKQLVEFATRGNNILDVIMTNNPNQFEKLKSEPPLGNSDHLVLIGNILNSLPKSTTNYIIKSLNFKRMNVIDASRFIREQLKSIENITDPTLLWNYFERIIDQCIKNYVPKTRTYFHNNKFIPSVCINLYNRMKRKYNNWKYTGNLNSKREYQQLKRRYRINIRRANTKFETSIISKGNPKFFL